MKYNGVERSRVVHEAELKTVIKQVLNNKKISMRALSKYSNMRDEMLTVVKQKIKSEMNELAKKSNTILKSSNENLMNFDTKNTVLYLKEKAPYLHSTLNCLVKNDTFISTAASILMYGHSQKLSQLQHIVGLALDRCGLTKEVSHRLAKKWSILVLTRPSTLVKTGQ